MSYRMMLGKHFDRVFGEPSFVEGTYRRLNDFGFNAHNTIACVSCCRDEISQSLKALVQEAWGEAFNLSSLGGLFTAGKTGLLAAMHHAPHGGDKERYVFYAFPHIAIDGEGKIGVCRRKGIAESVACGALNAFQKELASGRLNLAIDNGDIEQSLLKMRLFKEIPYGSVPDLLQLTLIARHVVQADLEAELHAVVDMGRSDYAVVTGVQIHGPDGNYIWPSASYAVVDYMRQDLSFGSPAPETRHAHDHTPDTAAGRERSQDMQRSIRLQYSYGTSGVK